MKDISDIPETDLGFTWEASRNQWYGGFIVIGKPYLNNTIYEALLKHQKNPKTWGNDQAVYNEFFDKKQITELPLKYNTTNDKIDIVKDIRVIHYIYKPDSAIGKRRLSEKQYRLWYDNLASIQKQMEGAGL